MDELAPLFESRDTRLGRLPPEARAKFDALTQNAADPEMADRLFVSVWLSQRTGLARKDVLKSFDGIASKYFGAGVTPSQAYDRIAEGYKLPTSEGSQPGQAVEAEFADTQGMPRMGQSGLLYNAGQTARSAGAGFTGMAQRVPAGLYSQAAAATGAPTMRDPMSIPEYAELKKQNQKLLDTYQFTQVYDEPMSFGATLTEQEEATIQANEKRMGEIIRGLDTEHRAAVQAWEKKPVAEVSKEYRRLADFWTQLSEEAPKSFGVDPQFQQTTLGKFAQSAGSVPATAALAALGLPGLIGMESAMFADTEAERRQAEGASYDPDKAFAANLASTLPQVALERALGVERILNSALADVPKFAGKIRFGDYVKQAVKTGATSAVEEGITEPSQGFWQDFVASVSYDEKRELLTGDAAKERFVEAVSGFALGFLFGGGISVVEQIDQARTPPEYITTHENKPLTTADFTALRAAKTDAELMASAPDEATGRLLIAAANGNAEAQQAYLGKATEAGFVDTDGLAVGGLTLGEVEGVPVVRDADGTITPLDLTNPDDKALFDLMQSEAVKAAPAQEAAEVAQQMQDALDRETTRRELEEVFSGRKPDAAERESWANYEKLKEQLREEQRAAEESERRKADFTKAKMEEALNEMIANQLSGEESIILDQPLTKQEKWTLRAVKEAATYDLNVTMTPQVERALIKDAGESEATLRKRVTDWADQAIASSQGRINAGVDPVLFAAYAVKGADLIRKGVVDFAAWSKAMLEEFGDAVRPELAKLFKEAKAPKVPANLLDQVKEGKGGAGDDDRAQEIRFGTTGEPQNAEQAIRARLERVRARRMAAARELESRIAAGSVPQRAAAVRRTTQSSLAARVLVPIATRLRGMSQEVSQRLRRFEFDLGQRLLNDFARVTPFAQGVERMHKDDAQRLDLALKNGDTVTRDRVLAQYGLEETFADVEKLIGEIRERAVKAGYEIGQIENYFPRKVADVDGLLTFYYGKPEQGAIEKAIAEAAKKAAEDGRALTDEERVAIVNTVLRGYGRNDARPSNTKERTTDVVSVEANQFYTDSIEALASYVEQMNSAIEKRRFFGKSAVSTKPAETDGNALGLNVDASVGAYVEKLIAQGKLDRAKQQQTQAILEARFNQRAASAFVQNFKSLAYMTTMGQITSTLTQLGDLAFSLYENGVYNTMVAGAQAAAGKSKVTRKELGLDQIAEEFRSTAGLHKALERVFRLTGMHYMDRIGKETIVNAKLRQLHKMAQGDGLRGRSKQIVEASFAPEEQAKVLADLAAGKKTEETLFTAYSVLADFQPINLSEYPEAYLRHPNGRIFYMLKTFTLKQLDTFRREGFSLIVNGNAKQKAEGFRNLLHLSALLFLIGVPVDALKDWVMGRKPRFSDLALDNAFKLMAVNRWSLWQLREHGDLQKFAMQLVTPPAPFLMYPGADFINAIKAIRKGDNLDLGELESWRMLPIIGAPIYWWGGGGETKVLARERRLRRQKEYAGR